MPTASFKKESLSHVLALGLLMAGAQMALAATNDTRFGFTGPEIFPIDPLISQLRVADLDGDGLQDLIVVNNSRAKINLLYNQTGKTNPVVRSRADPKRELNELPPDARFRIESIASEKRIASLVVADLNGDQRPDLAYFGEPKELVIHYNLGPQNWSAPKRWPAEDGLLDPNGLACGDLNGDELTDLVLVGENACTCWIQKTDHTFGEPERIPYSGVVKSIQILDINGDGRDDLLLVNWDSPNPLRFRLQNSAGQLGPEIHFSLPPVRSYWADDLNGDHKTEIVTIALNSGRAQLSTFRLQPAEALSGTWKKGQFSVLPLNKTTKARRGVLWADVDGDRLPDLLVAEPDSGLLTVYRQLPGGGLGASRSFPTFTGVSDLAVSDWDSDGRPEIFLLSSDERRVGVVRMDSNGRIPFPEILPLEGRPLALAVGTLEAGSPPVLAVIVDEDGKRLLRLRSSEGPVHAQTLGENFKSDPVSMVFHDADQDGRNDLVLLIPFEKIKVLRQTPGRKFTELDLAAPGGGLEQPWLCLADIDGDGRHELLLPQKNFLRAVILQSEAPTGIAGGKPQWNFRVKEQINGAASNSRLVAAAALANLTNQVPSLFLLDAERKALSLCERDRAGVWQVVRNVPLPASDFTSLQPINLGPGKPNSLAFVGLNTVASLAFSGQAWEFAELDGYETPIQDGYLHDVISGDLDQDGLKDLVFIETAKSHLDLVTFEPPSRLVPATRWRVFEERTFRNRRADAFEPREALVADLTGDGKNDLAVLVHDRILVYPQE